MVINITVQYHWGVMVYYIVSVLFLLFFLVSLHGD